MVGLDEFGRAYYALADKSRRLSHQSRTNSRTSAPVEFHCLLRGKPGKLVITEEALQFRSAKLLGHEVESQIYWGDIDTIKKVNNHCKRYSQWTGLDAVIKNSFSI